MERFAFKIDNVLRANLYKICRLCGIDNPEKVPIVPDRDTDTEVIDADGEPELSQKIKDLIGFTVFKDDKMPQFVCTLCVDKINDFYEFREMCFSTDEQTRKLLGIKSLPKMNSEMNLEVKAEPTPTDKRGKKRQLENLEIKEEMHFNALPTNKKKQRLQEDNFYLNKKKKKMRLTEASDITNVPNPVALSKKQMRLELKSEIKDEPLTADNADFAVPAENAQKLKQLCTICKQRFPTKNKLDRHKSNQHSPAIVKFFCTTCNEEVIKLNDIKSHQLWHKLSKTPYTCGLCGEALLTINLFTRHLSHHTQKLLMPILVFDRECSMCHETFITNFLYNTHPCAIRSKKCGGCNRKVKTDLELQMHMACCDKAYLVASKHIGDEIEAVRIKNENDVEADVENFTSNISVPLTMMPVVSLTRIPIEPNQKGNLASSSTDAATAIEMEPKSKKASKKGISKKDLKRVDDLLKSTIDALVSIKHEPEINVDAEPHAVTPQSLHQQLSRTTNENEDSNTAASENDNMHFGDDDFQNRDDDSNHSDLDCDLEPDVVVKEEPCEDHSKQTNTITIKTEIPDNINDEAVPSPSKVPVLKLKITKEHGTLNSSLIDESNDKSEKKKKKKKRKEVEKAANGVANNVTNAAAVNSPDTFLEIEQSEPIMPLPGIVHIKQERIDDEYAEECSVTQSAKAQPEATIMTSIPIMQFQISCVTSGVNFDKGNANKELEAADINQQNTQETELQDIKPNREELDRLLAENMENTAETGANSISTLNVEDSFRPHQQVQKTARKSVATKSTSQRKVGSIKAKQPIEQIPKIVAVSSGINLLAPGDELMPPVRIKTEPLDDDYYNQHSTKATAEMSSYYDEEQSEVPSIDQPNNSDISNAAYNDEQAYINSIDFSNIRIKEEKDIEVSESQLTAQHFSHAGAFNDSTMSNDIHDGLAAVENDKNDNENEDDDNEDDDEDYDDTEFAAEEENREYRELEWPPLLNENAIETVEPPSEPRVKESSLGLMVSHICSHETKDFKKEIAAETTQFCNLSKVVDSPKLNVFSNIQSTENDALSTSPSTSKNSQVVAGTLKSVYKQNKNSTQEPAEDQNAITLGTLPKQAQYNAEKLNATNDTTPNRFVRHSKLLNDENIKVSVMPPETTLNQAEETNQAIDSGVSSGASVVPAEVEATDEDSTDALSEQNGESIESVPEVQTVSNNHVNKVAANNEEQQNVINEEKCDSQSSSVSSNMTIDQLTPKTSNSLPNIEISNVTSLQLEPYLEDISSNSCSMFSSIGNDNSRNVADMASSTRTATENPIRMQTNHEETENLYNENIDAAFGNTRAHYNFNVNTTSNQHSQLATQHLILPQQLQSQPHALLLDNSNVNEIAENNNNANIERELLDDVSHHNVENSNEIPTPGESRPI